MKTVFTDYLSVGSANPIERAAAEVIFARAMVREPKHVEWFAETGITAATFTFIDELAFQPGGLDGETRLPDTYSIRGRVGYTFDADQEAQRFMADFASDVSRVRQ